MSVKQPRLILENLYAFAPNRATLGGTAYLIVQRDEAGNPANVLVDAPANAPETLEFIERQGGVKRWVITHRGASGEAKALQACLNCEVWVQEQEAYLLPDLPGIQPFSDRVQLASNTEAFWTPGYSPGSACVYWAWHGGVLFTGRHLLPDRAGQLMPLRISKTFHWPRQLRQVRQLQQRFSPETLAYVCPAANTGFLRGRAIVSDAYPQIQAINTDALVGVEPLL